MPFVELLLSILGQRLSGESCLMTSYGNCQDATSCGVQELFEVAWGGNAGTYAVMRVYVGNRDAAPVPLIMPRLSIPHIQVTP
jgi:hypothetical protein